MHNKIVRCAVVGLGRIASTLENDELREKPCTHIGAIVENRQCLLVAGCDIKKEARDQFLTDWGHLDPTPEVFDTAEALFESCRPDLLVVATYPDSHYPITAQAADSGVPVIICEKPLAYDLRAARSIARIHQQGKDGGGAKVLVNHERRYSANYIAVKGTIDEKRYGRIVSVTATLYFGKNTRHRDVLLHDGTHLVDMINFLCGVPVRIRRSFGSMGSNRGSAFIYGSAGTIPVVIEVGASRDHLVFEIIVSCETGRIRVGNGVLVFEKSDDSPYYEGYKSLLPDDTPHIKKTGYFSNMIEDGVRCFFEPDYQPLSSATDGLEAMKFIRSIRALL
jgi:predicted dehydrogenase